MTKGSSVFAMDDVPQINRSMQLKLRADSHRDGAQHDLARRDDARRAPALDMVLPALATVALTRRYGSRKILDQVGFELAHGEIGLLTGDNGSGKTTLLKCLAGVLAPSEGAVRCYGCNIEADPRRRRLVGFVAHQGGVYHELTVIENLRLAARLYGCWPVERRIASALDGAGLRDIAEVRTDRLSQGWRQRTAIARALIHDPLILLLDEPFSALDEAGRSWLANYLAGLRRRGRAVLLSAHADSLARSLADREFMLRDGRLFEREPRSLQQSPLAPARRAAA